MEQQAWLGLWPSETTDYKNEKPLATRGPRDGMGVSGKHSPLSGKQLMVHGVTVYSAALCLGVCWCHLALLRVSDGRYPGYDVSPHSGIPERAAATRAQSSGNARPLWLRALRLLGESWESRNAPEGPPAQQHVHFSLLQAPEDRLLFSS